MTKDQSALCHTCKNYKEILWPSIEFKINDRHERIRTHECVADAVEPEWFKLLIDPARNAGMGCSEYVERDNGAMV